MKRVVVTGMGIVSSLGNNVEQVTQSLKEGKSGIQFCEDYAELGMRSQIAGRVSIDQKELIDRKKLRFMGDAAAFSYVAMQQAIEDAGLDLEEIKNPKVGLITGSGGVRHRPVYQQCLVFKAQAIQSVRHVQRVHTVLAMLRI